MLLHCVIGSAFAYSYCIYNDSKLTVSNNSFLYSYHYRVHLKGCLIGSLLDELDFYFSTLILRFAFHLLKELVIGLRFFEAIQ